MTTDTDDITQADILDVLDEIIGMVDSPTHAYLYRRCRDEIERLRAENDAAESKIRRYDKAHMEATNQDACYECNQLGGCSGPVIDGVWTCRICERTKALGDHGAAVAVQYDPECYLCEGTGVVFMRDRLELECLCGTR